MEGYQVVTMDEACACGRHLRHHHRQRRRDHPRAHGPDEGRAPSSATSATSTARSRSTRWSTTPSWDEIKPQVDHVDLAGRQDDHRAGQGSAGEPRLRDRPPELRHEQQLHQPDHRPDRAVGEPRHRQVRASRSTCCPKVLDEKVARLHLEKLGVKLDAADAEAGRLHRRAGRRAVQAGALPVLTPAHPIEIDFDADNDVDIDDYGTLLSLLGEPVTPPAGEITLTLADTSTLNPYFFTGRRLDFVDHGAAAPEEQVYDYRARDPETTSWTFHSTRSAAVRRRDELVRVCSEFSCLAGGCNGPSMTALDGLSDKRGCTMMFVMAIRGAHSPGRVFGRPEHDSGSDTIAAAGFGCAAGAVSPLFSSREHLCSLGTVFARFDGGPETQEHRADRPGGGRAGADASRVPGLFRLGRGAGKPSAPTTGDGRARIGSRHRRARQLRAPETG